MEFARCNRFATTTGSSAWHLVEEHSAIVGTYSVLNSLARHLVSLLAQSESLGRFPVTKVHHREECVGISGAEVEVRLEVEDLALFAVEAEKSKNLILLGCLRTSSPDRPNDGGVVIVGCRILPRQTVWVLVARPLVEIVGEEPAAAALLRDDRLEVCVLVDWGRGVPVLVATWSVAPGSGDLEEPEVVFVEFCRPVR